MCGVWNVVDKIGDGLETLAGVALVVNPLTGWFTSAVGVGIAADGIHRLMGGDSQPSSGNGNGNGAPPPPPATAPPTSPAPGWLNSDFNSGLAETAQQDDAKILNDMESALGAKDIATLISDMQQMDTDGQTEMTDYKTKYDQIVSSLQNDVQTPLTPQQVAQAGSDLATIGTGMTSLLTTMDQRNLQITQAAVNLQKQLDQVAAKPKSGGGGGGGGGGNGNSGNGNGNSGNGNSGSGNVGNNNKGNNNKGNSNSGNGNSGSGNDGNNNKGNNNNGNGNNGNGNDGNNNNGNGNMGNGNMGNGNMGNGNMGNGCSNGTGLTPAQQAAQQAAMQNQNPLSSLLGGGGSGGGGMSDLTSMLPMMMMMPMMMLPMMMAGMGRQQQQPMQPQGPQGELAGYTPGAGPRPEGQNVSNTDDGDRAGKMQTVANEDGTKPASSVQSAGNSVPAGANTDVKLKDGTVVHASNAQAASAIKAMDGGANPVDAYKAAGVDLPPPGTPVVNPVYPPEAGDLAVFSDHYGVALGNDQILVNGQKQPASVTSGPDFMGWLRPILQSVQQSSSQSAAAAAPPAPATATSAPAAGAPS